MVGGAGKTGQIFLAFSDLFDWPEVTARYKNNKHSFDTLVKITDLVETIPLNLSYKRT